jgi:hypothetical protein
MMYIDLETYYRLNFALIQFHKWNPDFIENLVPYEREIYTSLLQNHLEQEEEKAKKNK